MIPRTIATLGLMIGLALASGCGPRAAKVAGKVTYNGKPVVTGSVTLKAVDGTIHQVGIKPDGTFEMEKLVPVGPAQVGVSSPDPKPSARALAGGDSRVPAGPPPPPPGAWFPLPAKFADPATSGVTIQVGSSPTIDIELK